MGQIGLLEAPVTVENYYSSQNWILAKIQGYRLSKQRKLQDLCLEVHEARFWVGIDQSLHPALKEFGEAIKLGHWVQVRLRHDSLGQTLLDLRSQSLNPNHGTKSSKNDVKPTLVEICRQKHCCQRGANHIWQDLQKMKQAGQFSDGIKLQATGCLKACKQGACAKINAKLYKHLDSQKLLDTLVKEIGL